MFFNKNSAMSIKLIYPFIPILSLWLVKDSEDPDYGLENPIIFVTSIFANGFGSYYIVSGLLSFLS